MFGNTHVLPRKWSKIHIYQSQNRKIFGIKILNKKEKGQLLNKGANAYLTLLYLCTGSPNAVLANSCIS